MRFRKNRSPKQPLTIRLRSRVNVFLINFGWSRWLNYIDGITPKMAALFPIIGYIILFNDGINSYFTFENLSNSEVLESGIGSKSRLQMLYFGLLSLGISNLIYRFQRPHVLKFAKNSIAYSRLVYDDFTRFDFIQMHERIRYEGHKSLDGKYYDSEWEGFLESSTNSGEGTDLVKRDGNWQEAKLKYGSLLRSIARDQFAHSEVQNQEWLAVCIFISTAGYILLLIPSIDLFIKVIKSILM